jgi:hypothetical protein
VSRATARWRARLRVIGDQWSRWREHWSVERELERALDNGQPIVVGPWLSEVGYETLYWVPFLRWVKAAYRIPTERIVVMSRGGTSSWYGDLGSRYVELLDHVAAGELSRRAASGQLKQREASAADRDLALSALTSAGIEGRPTLLHPSLMFQWFAPFWSGHETIGFVERHTRYERIQPPSDVSVPPELPEEYIAVKFYAARSLPDQASVRGQLHALVDAIAGRFHVVQLDTGLGLDDHAEFHLATGGRITSVSGTLDPRTNLGVQTRIIAGARMFVGTCGSLAWLAPLLGVPTLPVFTDDSFLHAHLHVARRVYHRAGGAAFSPVDLTGLVDAGLALAAADRLAARVS